MPCIYRVIYPNGKIYVGKDLTDTVAYFGSVDSGLIQSDFPPDKTDVFTVTKEILFRSDRVEEVNRREAEFIRRFGSNDPEVGYNRWPPFSS